MVSRTRSRRGPRAEEPDGSPPRRRRRPAAGLGSLRGPLLDAGHDGHRAQPRAQRRDRRGSRRGDRSPFRLRLLPALHPDVRPDRARASTGRSSIGGSKARNNWHRVDDDGDLPAEVLECSRAASYADGAGPLRRAVPAVPPGRSCAAPSRRCSESWRTPRAVAYRSRERIAHDLGTAVSVQTMVFGNRDDRSATGVGLHPQPCHRRVRAVRRLPGQRPGRGRGRRHAQHRAAGRPGQRASRTCTRELVDIFGRLERHYRDMLEMEFTDRAGPAVDAPDPCREAGGRRRVERGGGHDRRTPPSRSAGVEALLRVGAEHVEQVLHPTFADRAT